MDKLEDNVSFKQKVGKNIRKRRISFGLTQVELAKKANYLNDVSISRIENGAVSFANVKRIAKALECDALEFLAVSEVDTPSTSELVIEIANQMNDMPREHQILLNSIFNSIINSIRTGRSTMGLEIGFKNLK